MKYVCRVITCCAFVLFCSRTGLGGEYQFLAGPSFMAIFTIASIIWGILADKYDRVNILFSSSILFSLALVFTSVATKFWHLVVLRMLLAAG